MDKNWIAELLKLIRVKNLLMIAVTQYLVRFFVIKPVFFNYKSILSSYDIDLSLSEWQFALFVLATLCIAAAGYIINDYFDVEIDRINKPDKMVIGNSFSKQQAFRLHFIFNIIGVVLGSVTAWFAGNLKLGFIFIIVAGLLWLYAKTFKKVFLLGNILVAGITALTVIVPFLFETGLFGSTDLLAAGFVADVNKEIRTVVLAYALFAFLSTLIREIIKDIEDVEGDREYNCKTVPVVLGIKGAKGIAAFLIVLLIASLVAAQLSIFTASYHIAYILVALQLPLAAFIFYLIPAERKEDFATQSNWMKIVMLLGIVSMAVFHYMV